MLVNNFELWLLALPIIGLIWAFALGIYLGYYAGMDKPNDTCPPLVVGSVFAIAALFVISFVNIHTHIVSVRTALRALCETEIANPEFSDNGEFLGFKINIAEKK